MSEGSTGVNTSGQNAKLERFKESVLSEAMRRRDEILDEVARKRHEAVSRANAEIDQEVEAYLSEETEKLKAKYRQELAKVSFDGKKALLMKRMEIVDAVFLDVEKRIETFTKTPEYKTFLLERAKGALASIKSSDVIIYVGTSDAPYMSDIIKSWDAGIDVAESLSIKLGGLMIASKTTHLVIDETFDSKLTSLKSDFVKTSGIYFG